MVGQRAVAVAVDVVSVVVRGSGLFGCTFRGSKCEIPDDGGNYSTKIELDWKVGLEVSVVQTKVNHGYSGYEFHSFPVNLSTW